MGKKDVVAYILVILLREAMREQIRVWRSG